MTRAIYKYAVPVDDEWHEVSIHGPARVLHVDCQDDYGTVYLWAEVDIEGTGDTVRNMRAFATGQAIPDGASYVGTALTGPFVWHVYAEATK
jgi:hypothetical protein